jgi:hypothetical protein
MQCGIAEKIRAALADAGENPGRDSFFVRKFSAVCVVELRIVDTTASIPLPATWLKYPAEGLARWLAFEFPLGVLFYLLLILVINQA